MAQKHKTLLVENTRRNEVKADDFEDESNFELKKGQRKIFFVN